MNTSPASQPDAPPPRGRGRPRAGDALKINYATRLAAASVAELKAKAEAAGLSRVEALEAAIAAWMPTPRP